ncbi:MAG: hypothetical protein ABR500_04845 [Dermatophilaceae bacterium]
MWLWDLAPNPYWQPQWRFYWSDAWIFVGYGLTQWAKATREETPLAEPEPVRARPS